MRILLIAAGGALGTLLRYGVSVWLSAPARAFPAHTLAVNAIGCFVLSLIAGLTLKGLSLSADVRLALSVGFCGGLTTYSSVNQEVIALFEEGRAPLALLYAALTVIVCGLAGALGFWGGRGLMTLAQAS
ncbi:MAG: fluoride efflux transporter CrcB [Deltaproteobacteria bacterium]|nr:fluoride efflux transporter CrcB [Deltaproteobacteria bacterium]